jgi:hypothetical protein
MAAEGAALQPSAWLNAGRSARHRPQQSHPSTTTTAQRRRLRRVEHWHQRAAADLARLGASRDDLVELERITERLREQAYNL